MDHLRNFLDAAFEEYDRIQLRDRQQNGLQQHQRGDGDVVVLWITAANGDLHQIPVRRNFPRHHQAAHHARPRYTFVGNDGEEEVLVREQAPVIRRSRRLQNQRLAQQGPAVRPRHHPRWIDGFPPRCGEDYRRWSHQEMMTWVLSVSGSERSCQIYRRLGINGRSMVALTTAPLPHNQGPLEPFRRIQRAAQLMVAHRSN